MGAPARVYVKKGSFYRRDRGLKGVSRYHRVNIWKGGAAGFACRAGAARMVPNCKCGAETEDPVMEAVRGFHSCVIISFFWVMFRFFFQLQIVFPSGPRQVSILCRFHVKYALWC